MSSDKICPLIVSKRVSPFMQPTITFRDCVKTRCIGCQVIGDRHYCLFMNANAPPLEVLEKMKEPEPEVKEGSKS